MFINTQVIFKDFACERVIQSRIFNQTLWKLEASFECRAVPSISELRKGGQSG